MRLVFRILPYAAALLPFFLPKPFRKTPIRAEGPLTGVLLIYSLAFFHPQTNNILSGVATIVMTLAIMAPVFWAPQMIYGPRQIRRLLVILLVICGLDSGLGILQVYNPQRWIPPDMLAQMEDMKTFGGVYTGAEGQDIMRPPGLSNTIGGACASGMIGGVLGVAFLLGRTSMLLRLYSIAAIFLGAAVIYVSMVRTSLLVMCGMCVVLCLLNVMQRRVGKAVLVLVVAGGGLAAGLVYAISIGGDAVEKRYSTIVEQNPATFYYENRGEGVASTFSTSIFEYPIGGGLARWGQMRGYFGDESNPNSPGIFSEVMFHSWVIDGGVILLLLYVSAIVITIRSQVHLALSQRNSELGSLTATICAISCGITAMCFSYVPFVSQFGILFWLFAGALSGAANRAISRPGYASRRPV